MLTFIAILAVALPAFVIATLAYDTLAGRIDGFPPVEFTSRAYAA